MRGGASRSGGPVRPPPGWRRVRPLRPLARSLALKRQTVFSTECREPGARSDPCCESTQPRVPKAKEADMTKLLERKTAIIYGGGGGIGSGVARTFAREGARVFLVGRTRAKLDSVAKDIKAAGGSAEVAELDALDERAVDSHVNNVVSKTGRVDISFNLIARGD